MLGSLHTQVRRAAASRGFTLVELLVGLAVGALVLIGVIFSWGLAVRNNAYVLAVTALNNDMRSVMQVVTQDVRRATVEQENDLLIHISPDRDCITFTTAFAQASGALEQRVPSGYRLFANGNSGPTSLQVWTGGIPNANTCGLAPNLGGWEDLVVSGDRGVILEDFVVRLDLPSPAIGSPPALGSRCLNLDNDEASPLVLAHDPDSGEISCVGGLPGDRFVKLWLIHITLTGRMDLAPLPRAFTFTDAVKIRSDSVIN